MDDIIFEQLKKVRDRGATNMLDHQNVKYLSRGVYDELYTWLDSNSPGAYARMLIGPFSEWLAAEEA